MISRLYSLQAGGEGHAQEDSLQTRPRERDKHKRERDKQECPK